jgi:hypothetical protein
VAGKGIYPMAVRHDVENLIRRGNIFYWRARVPSSFAQCQPGSRLSLSLHCSDHKKAQAIGRKLNTLMAELKMKSKEPMSKAQLQKLCEHERDVMLLHLEDVSIVARRYGRPDDVEELELDLENGWAYKLLAMFGIRQKLTLVYTGSLNHDRGRGKPGPYVFHDAAYYLPIMFTYLGARRKEFAGLSLNDIEEDDDGLVIVLRTNEFRRLKTEQSERVLPLPDELIRLGFMDYCVALQALGYKAVFPDLISHKTTNDPGDRFYDVFLPMMERSLGDKMWKRAFHALRHGMADTLLEAGVGCGRPTRH